MNNDSVGPFKSPRDHFAEDFERVFGKLYDLPKIETPPYLTARPLPVNTPSDRDPENEA